MQSEKGYTAPSEELQGFIGEYRVDVRGSFILPACNWELHMAQWSASCLFGYGFVSDACYLPPQKGTKSGWLGEEVLVSRWRGRWCGGSGFEAV